MAGWAKISVGYYRDPAVAALRVAEREAFLRLILWSVEQGTDGCVPEMALRVAGVTGRQVQALCAADLVRANGSGWVIRSYNKYQEPAEAITARREARREAARRAAMARWGERGAD